MSSPLWLAAGALAVALAVVGEASFSAWNGARGDSPETLTRVGDTVEVHLTFFDAQGRMLLSTRASDRPEMENASANVSGLFALPLTKADAPQRYVVKDGLRPLSLDANASLALGESLIGKPVGHVAAFPLVGRFQGYDQVTTLERTRGPFNRTLTLSTATLDNLTGGSTASRVLLDDLFEADVLERGPVASRIRLDVQDGQRLAVRRAGFDATVLLDEAADQFHLRLDASVGHAFSLQASCAFARYVLPPGSYRVTGVDDATLTLASSPTKWPQLIDRDLLLVLEILSIQGTQVT